MNFIVKSITRSLIMLNTMKENENASFADISIPFLRWCSQHRSCSQYKPFSWHPDIRKGIEILAKLVFSFSFIVFNMMKLLVILFIMTLKCFCFLRSRFFDCLRCLKQRCNFFLPRACFLSDINWRRTCSKGSSRPDWKFVYRVREHFIWASKFKKGRKRKNNLSHKSKKLPSVNLSSRLNKRIKAVGITKSYHSTLIFWCFRQYFRQPWWCFRLTLLSISLSMTKLEL